VPPDLAGLASAVTVVMRQGGFAVGIAVLGAVLHNQESAISYVWLFSAAAVASAAGLVAALVLLPASTAPSKSSRVLGRTRPGGPGSRGLVIFSAASTALGKPLQQRNHHGQYNGAPSGYSYYRPERIVLTSWRIANRPWKPRCLLISPELLAPAKALIFRTMSVLPFRLPHHVLRPRDRCRTVTSLLLVGILPEPVHAALSEAEISPITHFARVPGIVLPQEAPSGPVPVCPPPAVTDLHDAHPHPGFTMR